MVDFYAPLSEKLSQGDIITNVPWGLIASPTTICRPANGDPKGKAEYARVDLAHKPFSRTPEFVHMAGRVSPAMVLWHDCQIDKMQNLGRNPEKWFAAIAPVLPAPANPEHAKTIADGKNRRFFPLPANPEVGIETASYCDLRHIVPVWQSMLLESRSATLSTGARDALYLHLFSFLTQREVSRSATCPSCQAAVPFESLFPSLSDES